MKIYKLFLLIILTLPLFAQENIFTDIKNESEQIVKDTLQIDFLLDTIWKMRRTNPKTSVELLNHVDELLVQKSIDYKKDVVWYYSSLIYKSQSDFTNSERYLKKYLEYNIKKEDTVRAIFGHQALCNLYFDFKYLDKSMTSAYKSLELNEGKKDTQSLIITNGRIGAILMEMGNYKDAIKHQNTALELAKVSHNNDQQANIYNDFGLIYEQLENPDSMLFYYKKFLEMSLLNKNEHQQLYANFNLGSAYSDLKDYKKANEYFKKGIGLAQLTNDQSMEDYSKIAYAGTWINLGNPSKAINLLSDIKEEEKEVAILKDLYKTLYLAHAEKLEFKKAFDYHILFKSTSDTILNQDVSQQVSELKIEYETELKENEISHLNTENKVIELKLGKATKDRLVAFAGMAGLALILLLLYRNLSIARKSKKLLEEKNSIISIALKEKEILLKEIHHRVKNNLQVISSLLSIQSRNVVDKKAKLAIQEGRNRVKSMALIHQNLYQEDNLIGVSTKDYIEKLSSSLINSYKVNHDKIKINLQVEDVNLDVEKIIPVGLILNELISNALKYAFPEGTEGEISIKLTAHNKDIDLSVSDNGIGISSDFNLESDGNMGFQLLRSFSTKLKAKMELRRNEPGTTINLRIPNVA